MSWLRDPDTGDIAGALDADAIDKIVKQSGRPKQRRGWRWRVNRRDDGSVESIELRPVPKDEKGLSL